MLEPSAAAAEAVPAAEECITVTDMPEAAAAAVPEAMPEAEADTAMITITPAIGCDLLTVRRVS